MRLGTGQQVTDSRKFGTVAIVDSTIKNSLCVEAYVDGSHLDGGPRLTKLKTGHSALLEGFYHLKVLYRDVSR